MRNKGAVAVAIVAIILLVAGSLVFITGQYNSQSAKSAPGQAAPAGGSQYGTATSSPQYNSTTASYSTTSQPSGNGPSSQSSGQNVSFGYFSFPQSALDAITVTSNPVNLSQLSEISKFRSCAGHDFSGYDFNGTQESARSMKHYFTIKSSYTGLSHVVQIFAPFNGTLIYDNKQLDYPNGDQIVVKPSSDPVVGVEIFHIDLLPNISVGSTVKSGQLIGYKNASETSGFDIAYGPLSPYYPCGGKCQTPMADVWDSVFNHMAPQVLSQFSAVGINQANIVVTKSYRDANPCFYPNETSYGSSGVNAIEYTDPKNWVNVT
ncbi:MAG: hypothetical protein KGH98_03700 [Candidatus Micrarchaeota archaeon]|nr:hypothetical protein [Candidatus Micrarchaeota archaeon]